MARIRTLKPEFWGDEKLAPRSTLTRLVFLGLISFADDAGRLVDNVKAIDGELFPETSDSAAPALDELAAMRRILRYTSSSGQKLIQILNWGKHQKVDNPSRYVLPGPMPEDWKNKEVTNSTRVSLDNISRFDLGPTTKDLLPTTLDLGPTTSDQRPDACAVSDEEFVSLAIRAANRGLADNPAIGDSCQPIPTQHASRQAVFDWLTAGISREVITATVYAVGLAYTPDGRRKQISTMKYFDGAVRDAQDRAAAKTTEGPNGNGKHRGNTRGPRRETSAEAEGSGPPRKGKFDSLTERNTEHG